MTTTEIERPAPPAAVPPPTVFRLRNPWTPHLLGACAVAALTTVGAGAGAVMTQSARLDWSVVAVLLSLLPALVLSTLHGRFEKCPPDSAFVPVATQVTGGVR